MQVTNHDIQAMQECISDMFGGVSVFIHPMFNYYVFSGSEPEHKTIWKIYIHTQGLISKEFDSWEELKAWAHSQDKDFSEQVLMEEVE